MAVKFGSINDIHGMVEKYPLIFDSELNFIDAPEGYIGILKGGIKISHTLFTKEILKEAVAACFLYFNENADLASHYKNVIISTTESNIIINIGIFCEGVDYIYQLLPEFKIKTYFDIASNQFLKISDLDLVENYL